MEKMLQPLKDFEKRNNMSATLIIHSDGSGQAREFWDEEYLFDFANVAELLKKLSTISYELDKNGRSYSPVRLVKPSSKMKK